MKIISNINNNNFIYYELVDNNIIYSYLEAYYDKKDNEITLTSINTDNNYRNKGYASILLQKLIEHAHKLKCIKIIVDDCSDNSRKSHNIYIKHGFEYIEKKSIMPEMVLWL